MVLVGALAVMSDDNVDPNNRGGVSRRVFGWSCFTLVVLMFAVVERRIESERSFSRQFT